MNLRYLKRKESDPQLDITPLIDMVFILLIFFMVSTTFVKDMKIDVERPSASTATRTTNKEVRVHIERSGALYIEGLPVKPWMLQSRLRDLIKSGASSKILVVTDKLVAAEKLIEVVDQCRLGGASDVGVATQKEAG
jgi:biopolymer transport protein ExbD